MKIFYFSTVCSNAEFEKIVKNSKKKPSASAQLFEQSFLKGFIGRSDAELEIHSFVPVSAFPTGDRLFIKKKTEYFNSEIKTTWLSAVNIQLIKQITFAASAKSALKKWLIKNNGDKNKCVVIYSLYPPVSKVIIELCEKFGCKCFVFIADLPKLAMTNTSTSGIRKLFSKMYRSQAVDLQKGFDGYIYFTEQMKDEVAPDKPYTVIEAVCNPNLFDTVLSVEKSNKKAIMYAGMLYKKYGADLLVNSFLKLEGDYELWLFGDGDYVSEIESAQKLDSRIKYFGRVSHSEILKYEKRASLLVNVRNCEDEYTKYSFPSKTVEYMLSETPVLSSKLQGIPDEYYDYIYSIDDISQEKLTNKFIEILSQSELTLSNKGKSASSWIREQKNCNKRVEQLLNFLNEVVNNENSSN